MSQFLAVSAILFFSSVIQGTVGFASGLFAIPLLMMIGMGLPESVMINLVASLVQSTTGAYQLRRKIDPRRTIRPILIRLLFMPLGIYAMQRTDDWRQTQVTQIIGVVLLAIVLIQWAWHIRPRPRLHPAWDYLTFSTSGFMAGFCGMGGPLMVLWVMAHTWSAAKSRAFLFIVFAVGMIPQAIMMLVQYGTQLTSALLLGLAGIVMVLAGTAIGLRLGAGLSRARLRQAVYTLLVLIALGAIIRPG